MAAGALWWGCRRDVGTPRRLETPKIDRPRPTAAPTGVGLLGSAAPRSGGAGLPPSEPEGGLRIDNFLGMGYAKPWRTIGRGKREYKERRR